MESIGTVLDIGHGNGHDLNWWATRTIDIDDKTPLNIKCTGIDIDDTFDSKYTHHNITTVKYNFEDSKLKHNQFDVIYAHNVLQYGVNPLQTLGHWWDLARDNAMLVIAVPSSTFIQYNTIIADQHSHDYYHWSLVSLIHHLAVNGWDCKDGFFKQERNSPWIYAVAYKQPNFKKLDYRTTTWFDLAEQQLLPETAVNSLNQWNLVRQQDLKLMWLNKQVFDFRNY
jgi:SAM-dependent methyltransferase